MTFHPKTALITGASSGIGAALARKLAAEGLQVLLVARREERLLALQAEIEQAGGTATIFPLDLSVEANRQGLFARTSSIPVDLLINCAGFGWYGYYAEMTWEIAHKMMVVNVEATIHLTRLFLPGMQARHSGHIINISSIAGSFPSQGNVMYSATKAFLDAFTTALYRETRGTGVEISLVRPGPVKTEFFSASVEKENGRRNPVEGGGVSVVFVVEKIWHLIKHPRRVLHVPAWAALAPFFELTTGWIQDLIGPVHLKNS